jgi:uncharacterized membrane protein (Fun14 family)
MMDIVIYLLPIGFIVSFVVGYFAVKKGWKITEYF